MSWSYRENNDLTPSSALGITWICSHLEPGSQFPFCSVFNISWPQFPCLWLLPVPPLFLSSRSTPPPFLQANYMLKVNWFFFPISFIFFNVLKIPYVVQLNMIISTPFPHSNSFHVISNNSLPTLCFLITQ